MRDSVPIRLRRDDLFARCACWRHMEGAIRPVQGVTECVVVSGRTTTGAS